MALDVRLSRDVDEPWGFELFGGADEEMPLTIEKIQSDSPAKRAGLLNGDTVLTINGEEAIDMSLDAACRRVDKCGHSLTVGVLRGLYDPVLDDQEPIYDYGLEDLGPQSDPTEVSFKIQQFVDPSDLGSNLLDFESSPGSRSLTASPFVTPTKPYRPFSTEPVPEVPPLEDPIILNPNYRDEFGNPVDTDPDYILSAHFQNGLGGQGRYKLPISEQYDPDGTRFVQNSEVVEKLLKYEKHVKSLSKDLQVVDVTKETKVSETVSKDFKESLATDVKETFKKDVSFSEERRSSKQIKHEERRETFREDVEEESIKEELQYIEKMRQEIDLEKIEETALSVVKDSIERAVSVAEEVKKEIEEELSSSEVEDKSERDVSKTVKSERSKSVEFIDDTEMNQAKSTKVTKESNLESVERKMSREEKYETINESELMDKFGKVERKSLTSEQYEREEIVNQPRRKESSEHGTFEKKFESKAEFKEETKTFTSAGKSDRKDAEQRAYTIGLQTIPNIRGVVHSSYHYDLLLRTFFLHLTDVMVALSRFLLSQPIFNQLTGAQEILSKTQESGVRKSEVRKSSQEMFEATKLEKKESVKPVSVKEMKTVSQKIEKDMKVESVQEKKMEMKEIIKPVAVKAVKQEERVEKMAVEKKAVTGAQMAQRSEKKLSQDLTQKMDAVISEFQTIAVEDVKQEMLQKDRRSRSRSQIEEEVMKESDPLEWLAKVDSRRTSEERIEMSKKEFSSAETMEKRSKVETKHETSHKKSKSPKQTYIAIVESHVYTNKDVIFEDLAEFSETSSVQSAEEINTAFEAVEAVSTENVAVESAVRELETAKIVEESQKLATVTAKSAATVQKIEEQMHDSKELIQEEYKKETAIQSSDVQEVLVQETNEIVEPVVEIKQQKVEKVEKAAVDINESLSVAEATEISIHESKKEFSNVDVQKETVAIVEEERAVEKVVESKAEVIEPKPVEVVEITETIKIKPKVEAPVHDEYAAIKIVKTVPVDNQLSPEIIEIEDISELALISKAVISQSDPSKIGIEESKQVVEKSYVTTETGIAKAEAKRQSIVDVSQASEESSQIGVLSVKQELEASKKEAESKMSAEIVQESTFVAKSGDRKLSLRTDLDRQMSIQSPPSTIDTPTPSTIPPTPLTDEYVFKLKHPLPRSRSATPVPRDCSLTPEDEDPHIVKKKLIPHIETKIERVVYDPPLPTPAADKIQSPVFTKPGLNGGGVKIRPVYVKPGLYGGAVKIRIPVYRKLGLFGGADNPETSKEEIREIERKSSLLASAIDETIKSIEEYKEEVGIDTKKEVKVQKFKEQKVAKSYQESYTKGVRMESNQNGFQQIESQIEEIIEQCNALDAFNNIKENNTSAEDIDTKKEIPIKIEVEREKESIETESKPIESEREVRRKSLEKTVNFESDIKEERANEVLNVEDQRIEIQTKENVPVVPVDVKQSIHKKKETEAERHARTPELKVQRMKSMEEKPEKTKETAAERHLRTPELKEERMKSVEEKTGKTKETAAERHARTPELKVERMKSVEEKPEMTKETAAERHARTPELKVERMKSVEEKPEKTDSLVGFRPVVFEPETIPKAVTQQYVVQEPTEIQEPRQSPYMTETGELIGTTQGIVDGLEDPVMDEEVAKALGKPGISEEKIAELISGEAEVLREAHVMGVDFQKIKPMIESLKDSEVLKALNEELARQKEEEKKKEEKKWTTFLQKPKRPVPKAKYGYQGWTQDDQVVVEPYKVTIVKQPKPKVAPDYKPEDFDTGPLPWEERAVIDASLPPVEPEEPILIPEVPEFLEAVDPLTESEVPDLEDTGIPLPPPKEPTPPPTIEEPAPEPEPEVQEVQEEVAQEEKQETEDIMESRIAEQLVRSVQNMVDPNASVDQQLCQMRAQLAALAQLPEVIQQSLDLVTRKISTMNQESHVENQSYQQDEENQNQMQTIEEANENTYENQNGNQNGEQNEADKMTIEEVEDKMEMGQQNMQQEQENMRTNSPMMSEEEIRAEKQRKEQERLDHISRQVQHHPTPRPGTPKRMFGPPDPEALTAVILPGGRRWRNTKDVYDEQKIAEIIQAHSELLNGKTMGFESDLLPYDNRINFMKYEKPPVSLDHLKHSEVYKLVHDMDQTPLRRIEMATPVMCEADYRERCRSMTPSAATKHLQIPQQLHP